MIKDPKLKKVNYDPFRSGRVEKAIPATLSQREMWSTLVLDADASICYNEVICMEISGSLSEMRLDKAFQSVLKRHEALRSSFSSDGKFFVVHEYKYHGINVVNALEEELDKFKEQEVSVPFDLVKGPLTRASLIKVSNSKAYFLFSAHHIVCDGWSLAIILTELTRAYESIELGPVSSFVSFALNENSRGIVDSDRNYWLDIFKTPFSGNHLPLDYPRPLYRSFESKRIDLDVSSELVVRLKKFSAQNRISFYTLLMGGFSILLNELSKKDDVVVGMATAAQSIPGNEEVVGHLVNMLPIRSVFKRGEPIKDYLQRLKTHMMDGIDHQCYTFGNLIQDLNIVRNPREIPIINVVFNIDQQLPDQGLEFRDVKASYQAVPRIKENFEIFINAVSRDKELTIECQYNKKLFKEETIRNWLNSYVELLSKLLTAQNISELRSTELFIPGAIHETEEVRVVSNKRNTLIEARLISIWKDLLKKEIEASDNFFSKGGHSLLVLEMIQQIEETLSKKVSVREVFENPTIIELAAIVGEHESCEVQKISSVDKKPFYKVTPAQMQTWYLEEVFKSTPMHNLPSSIELKFDLDVKVLEKAIEVLINRHESMRTVIKTHDGIAVAQIDENEVSFNLPVVETSLGELQGVLNKLASEVIDKEKLFPFRAKLLKIAPKHFVLFFMPHHAIWDGWSFDIFFEELGIAYAALLERKEIIFKNPIKLTYKDYAHWLDQQLVKGALDGERNYWVNKLALPLPALDLTKGERPQLMSHAGKTYAFTLDKELSRKLNDFCLEQGVSLYNVFLTAFKMSLSKAAQLNDIIVGTPVRCRNFPELLNVIGYFVNTVALRTDIDSKASFASNLKKVVATSIEAFDHSQLPYQELVKSIKYPRDPSRTPIYQAFFSYQDVSNRRPELAGHPYQQINIDKNSTHTDLDLWIKASANKIEGAFEFREDLIDVLWINNFYQTFLDFLRDVISVEEIPEIPKKIDVSSETVVSLFEEQVRVHADKVAIKSENSRLSYLKLNERANIYANALISQGIGSGDFVGIALSRHTEMLPALMGILKAGAAYVPLDPAFPQDRLDYMIENSQIRFLITENKHAPRFNKLKQILIEDIASSSSSSSISDPQVFIDKMSSAYVIYTSGSTGKPKGVEITHENLKNFLVSMSKTPGIKSTDRLLAVTTLSFDIAGLELFLPLITGASIYLANQFDVMDGQALRGIIEKHSINYMQATPSTWRLLLAAGWRGDPSFKVLCGGEAFPKDLAYKLIPMVDSVWNMYGPTETTIWSTCKQLNLTDKQITVGMAIDNTTIYILNEKGEILSQGEEGELYIGGLGVAKGYYNRSDLTDERFISHPTNGERIYATGDLALIDSSGELVVLGRLDGQVKVRGYRIELGEIEAQLNMMEGIDVTAAITKEVSPGDARIIAFILTKNQLPINEDILREYLGQSLPKYMIPSHFVFIEKMPQTLNGKIDKKTLGTMFHTEKKEEVVQVITHSTQIEEIRELWKNVLVVNELRDDDNFFDVGGNSLLAVELSHRMAKHFGESFQLRTLLEKPSFLEFAQSFTGKLKTEETALGNTSYVVSIRKGGELPPLFCVHTVGGNVLNYAQLLPAISNRPLYGIQSAGLVKDDHPGSVPELATLYIKEMKMVQPHGPYYIAGGSMGGMLALEIAQQLTKAGDEIGKLILFDTFGPHFDSKKYKRDEASRIDNMKRMTKYYYEQIILKIKKRLFKFIGAEYTLDMKLLDLETLNYKALWKYQAQTYAGDMHLIRNELKKNGWYADPYLGWKDTIKGELHVDYIKASHEEFIESPDLINALKKLL